MNHTDIISTIETKTGLPRELCQNIVKAFEKEVGLQVLTKMGKQELITEEIVQRVAASTGASPDDCRIILTAMNEAIAQGISDKTHL